MTHETFERPKPLAIDLDQWRFDIKTFAQTTNQALDAIVAQLSNSCSNGSSFSQPGPPSQQVLREKRKREINDDGRSDRLEELKSRLAQRISKSS